MKTLNINEIVENLQKDKVWKSNNLIITISDVTNLISWTLFLKGKEYRADIIFKSFENFNKIIEILFEQIEAVLIEQIKKDKDLLFSIITEEIK